MVYSSIPVTPSKSEKKDTSIRSNDLDVITKEDEPRLLHPPSLFTDKNGNLKFVNFIVRYPCSVFFIILALCIFITVNLSRTAFQNGYPFTPDDSTFDLYDKRSLAFDGLRLGKEEVEALRKTVSPSEGNNDQDKVVRLQERLGDVTYWIYEAKTDKGVFTKDALPVMRSAEVLFTRQKKYPEYCRLQYQQVGNETNSKCMRELSVLNTFYASSWNSSIAKAIITELTEEKIQLYNSIAACVEFGMLCQYNPPGVTTQDIEWARSMNKRIMSMIVKWDGEGSLNENPYEVSLLLAHIKELNTKAPYVNFFVDSNFNIDNPVAMYSRSIIYWGAPLANANDSSRRSSSRTVLKK